MARRHKAVRRHQGISLAEAVISCFIALAATLIFASGMPLANRGRFKAEKANIALSLAKKELESIQNYAFSNIRSDQLANAGLLESSTPVDIHTNLLYGPSGYKGYEFSNVDLGSYDSASNLLPKSRAFVVIDQLDQNSKRVDVLVFWQEPGVPRFIKLSRLFVNL